MKRALIVVDVQNDFLPGGPLEVPEGDHIIDYVIGLMQERERYDLLVASQDWHPPAHGSFASTHPGAEPFEEGELDGLPQTLWPDHCIRGTRGAHLEERVGDTLAEAARQGQQTLIVKKGQDKAVDSYSAFFDNARRHDTGLHKALAAHGIEAVDVVGLAFDVCVKATALDAASLGYETRVLMQGTRAIAPDEVEDNCKELEEQGVQIED